MWKGSHWGVCSEKLAWKGASRQSWPGCGLLGEVPSCPVLVLEATCGQELADLVQGLEAGSVQKGSHWGACSKMLDNLALWEEPTAGGHRAAWGGL